LSAALRQHRVPLTKVQMVCKDFGSLRWVVVVVVDLAVVEGVELHSSSEEDLRILATEMKPYLVQLHLWKLLDGKQVAEGQALSEVHLSFRLKLARYVAAARQSH